MSNREIKFRAYDTDFGIMLNNVVVYDHQNIAMVDVAFNEAYGDRVDERNEAGTEEAGPEWVCITGALEIMRYTGLKDKNGVDIYEGDIVDRVENIRLYGNRKYEVYWNNDASCWWPLISIRPNELEVIGNIYEHPNLLAK